MSYYLFISLVTFFYQKQLYYFQKLQYISYGKNALKRIDDIRILTLVQHLQNANLQFREAPSKISQATICKLNPPGIKHDPHNNIKQTHTNLTQHV